MQCLNVLMDRASLTDSEMIRKGTLTNCEIYMRAVERLQ